MRVGRLLVRRTYRPLDGSNVWQDIYLSSETSQDEAELQRKHALMF